MYIVTFSAKATDQYLAVIDRVKNAKKSLQTFEKELEFAIRRLERMPESYPPKGKYRAARLAKSGYYLFFRIEEEEKRTIVLTLISQKASPENWPG